MGGAKICGCLNELDLDMLQKHWSLGEYPFQSLHHYEFWPLNYPFLIRSANSQI